MWTFFAFILIQHGSHCRASINSHSAVQQLQGDFTHIRSHWRRASADPRWAAPGWMDLTGVGLRRRRLFPLLNSTISAAPVQREACQADGLPESEIYTRVRTQERAPAIHLVDEWQSTRPEPTPCMSEATVPSCHVMSASPWGQKSQSASKEFLPRSKKWNIWEQEATCCFIWYSGLNLWPLSNLQSPVSKSRCASCRSLPNLKLSREKSREKKAHKHH